MYVLLFPRLDIVTENVWEEMTDDEAESNPQPAKKPKQGLYLICLPLISRRTRACLEIGLLVDVLRMNLPFLRPFTCRFETIRRGFCCQVEKAEAYSSRRPAEKYDVIFRQKMNDFVLRGAAHLKAIMPYT